MQGPCGPTELKIQTRPGFLRNPNTVGIMLGPEEVITMYYVLTAGIRAEFQTCWFVSMLGSPDLVWFWSYIGLGFWRIFVPLHLTNCLKPEASNMDGQASFVAYRGRWGRAGTAAAPGLARPHIPDTGQPRRPSGNRPRWPSPPPTHQPSLETTASLRVTGAPVPDFNERGR